MRPPFQGQPEAVDSPPSSSLVDDIYNGELDAESKWDLLGTRLSSKIDFYSSLREDFAMIRNICMGHSVRVPTTAAVAFQLALWGVNILVNKGNYWQV